MPLGRVKLYHLVSKASIKQSSKAPTSFEGWIPELAVSHHAVEYGQELPHTCSECQLLRLTGRHKRW